MAKGKKQINIGQDRSLREIARHEYIRTGRKSPGAMERAFNLKYPNRYLSERSGPKFEQD